MSKKTWKCPECGEKYPLKDVEDGTVETHYGNISEQEICWSCYESGDQYASTIVRFTPGEGKEAIRFTEHHAYNAEDGDEPGDWFWTYFGGRKWHASDAWRGHYETTFKNGFIKLAEGWVTGYPDDTVSHKQTSIDLNEYLEEHASEVPAPIYWLFEPTSNIFSTASEIFIDHKDKDVVVKWLKKSGFNLEDISNSFD